MSWHEPDDEEIAHDHDRRPIEASLVAPCECDAPTWRRDRKRERGDDLA